MRRGGVSQAHDHRTKHDHRAKKTGILPLAAARPGLTCLVRSITGLRPYGSGAVKTSGGRVPPIRTRGASPLEPPFQVTARACRRGFPGRAEEGAFFPRGRTRK